MSHCCEPYCRNNTTATPCCCTCCTSCCHRATSSQTPHYNDPAPHMFGRAGSMTFSTESTAMGERRDEYWDTTLLLRDLQTEGQQCIRCRRTHDVCMANVCMHTHSPPQAACTHMHRPQTHTRLCTLHAALPAHMQAPCPLGLMATHVVAARRSCSLSSRLTGIAMDSRICKTRVCGQFPPRSPRASIALDAPRRLFVLPY